MCAPKYNGKIIKLEHMIAFFNILVLSLSYACMQPAQEVKCFSVSEKHYKKHSGGQELGLTVYLHEVDDSSVL